MVQNFCCCWCLVLLVTVGRSALRFENTLWTFSAEIQQATDDYSTAGLLYYGAVLCTTTQPMQYILCSATQQFEAVRSFKAGVGIHHYTMTTIQPTAARLVGSSIYEYGSTARAIHDGRRRLIAVRRVGGDGASDGGAAGATLSAGVACMDQAVNHCHSDGSSCSPVFTTATTTRLPPPPQQPLVCPVEVKHDTHQKM